MRGFGEFLVAMMSLVFGVGLVVAVFALLGLCFDYSLFSIIGKDVPWWADVIGGIVTNGFIFITAVLCWILRLAGVEAPFIHTAA